MYATIADNHKWVCERIEQAALRCGRRAEEIRLVAVAKTGTVDRIKEAVAAGVDILGENYVQEAQSQYDSLGAQVQWHLIGHLQSNKTKIAVRLFDVFETVDRMKIISELQRQAHQVGKRVDIMIQVNLAGESTKSGTSPDQVLSLIEAAASCDNLRCVGLMTIPPYYDDPDRVRPAFAALRRLRDQLQVQCPQGVVLGELSMGMSGDFEVAIEEGATLVRIGTALFGPRQ